MISRTTPAFRERFAALPADVQRHAREAYHLFLRNPQHPSLHFKRMRRRGTVLHSVRIGLAYRALAYEQDDALYWFWIGPHAEYDHLIDRL